MVDFFTFFMEHYLLAWIFIPPVLIYKAFLFVGLTDEPQVDYENFFYFGHPNVATTHDRNLQQKKKIQNVLSITVVVLVLLQLVLAVPVFISTH